MKKISYKILIPGILIIFGIIKFISIMNTDNKVQKSGDVIIKDHFAKEKFKRESITFILGEDKELDNPFYAEATNYYLFNEEGKTEQVVTNCRSLLEVQDYLNENHPAGQMPWGLINLVSHGNQWVGLSVKVTPHSKRATSERIREYMENDSLIQLSDSIIDNETEIFIHACGLGNNKEILNTIADAFSGGDSKPKVRASKLFEFYTSVKDNDVVRESQMYYADAQFISYKMGYKPEDQIVVNLLNQKYPNSDIDFSDAVSREQARFVGDTYHYTFEVPVKWVIKYKDSASYPDLSTKKLQVKWINEQKEITDVLKKIDIPINKFNWWFRDVYVNNENGTKSPAVWLKGYCTILCVIKPLTKDKNTANMLYTPFVPDVEDEEYYYTVTSI